MPQEDISVTRIGAVRIFAETAAGQWLPVGSAQVDRHAGRDVLRVTLDATPTTGRLCLSLADLDVLRHEETGAGHA